MVHQRGAWGKLRIWRTCVVLAACALVIVNCNPPDKTPPCKGSEKNCGGVCRDTTSDNQNCGACGVACGAKLYALKISSGSTGSATNDAIVSAWNWCITHKNDDPNNPILVISTSFGARPLVA